MRVCPKLKKKKKKKKKIALRKPFCVTDCSDGYQYPYYVGMVDRFTIQPILSPTPFTVFCSMTWGGRTIIQYRKNKPQLFRKSWNAYKNGFGTMAWPGDFWLGNEKIHYLTASRPRLLLQLYSGYYWRQISYLGFVVGNETQNFKMNFDTVQYASEAKRYLGDCLSPLRNASFSTPDADHDGESDLDCAGLSRSGWWFRGPDCSECNLNAVMKKTAKLMTYSHWTPTFGDALIDRMFLALTRP